MLTALQSVPTTAKASTMIKAAKRRFISTLLPLNLHVGIFAASNADSITCWEACREPNHSAFVVLVLEAVLNIFAQSFHRIQVVLVGVMTSILAVHTA